MKGEIVYSLFCLLYFQAYNAVSQNITTPSIIEIQEDDRVATVIWNSKTAVYDFEYDPDKQDGIYSYKIEWGPVSEGFIHSSITPYRAHMCQPLDPNVMYQARVYSLDTLGRQSTASSTVTFQHDDTKVNDMRNRLNGFFDDFNTSMGAFEERDWNQSYSGCMAIGKVSQHINNQFHAHNVIASNHCDRAAASSRVRHAFDFTNRTGIIEFDLDGSQRGRQFWYLDLSPFSRKRDLTGHTSIGTSDPDASDPPHMLRIAEIGESISIQIANDQGRLFNLPNMFENGANCGEYMDYCPGENLAPLINVRKHWRIELSKTSMKIFINGIKVVDGSLISTHSPNGLEFEIAQVNWLTFSYNTPKENFILSMVHWDNFGFDAPAGYEQQQVIHNYTDGELGSETDRTGNDYTIGKVATMDLPALSSIPIPDNLLDQNGNLPVKAELMFCIQGSNYNWDTDEYIKINNHTYVHPEPHSDNPNLLASELINTIRPYSAIIDLDPTDLIQGVNAIEFYLHDARLLNIHIELHYPIDVAPGYTPPKQIYADHVSKLMGFWQAANTAGPGIVFNEINGTPFWTLDSEYQPTPEIGRWYLFEDPVSEELSLSILANSEAQLAATGEVTGISYYEIWIDQQVVKTVFVNQQSEVAEFKHEVTIDLTSFSNGVHELFVQAYDSNGTPSFFDAFQAHAGPGEYLPTLIDIQNVTTAIDLLADDTGITLYPNPSNGEFLIRGNLEDYRLSILDINGEVYQDISTSQSELRISLPNLPNGLYFLQVVKQDNSIVSLQKILKQ